MTSTIIKNVDRPDETRAFPEGKLEVVKVGDLALGRFTLGPRWRWSECVKPAVGTDLCLVHHHGLVVSGRMRIRMEDGVETEVGPGDAFSVPPRHDAWIVGDEPCIALDVSGASVYGKPHASEGAGAIEVLGTFSILEGKQEALDAVVVAAVALARTEPGCLAYEAWRSEDRTALHWRERYRDSAALLVHLQAVRPLMPDLLACVTPTGFTMYGTPSAELRAAVAPFGMKHATALGGFVR
jgi:quinol monooxygenase YgiN